MKMSMVAIAVMHIFVIVLIAILARLRVNQYERLRFHVVFDLTEGVYLCLYGVLMGDKHLSNRYPDNLKKEMWSGWDGVNVFW